MSQIAHKNRKRGPRPRSRPAGVARMEYFVSRDKREPKSWVDKRKPDVPYKYRFDMPEIKYDWTSIRIRAFAAMKALRYVSKSRKPTAKPITAETVNKASTYRPKTNVVDYASGFLGFRCTRYRLGYNGIGGMNPFSSVIHGQLDFDIMVEDQYRYNMVEFVVAHEIGHYILHNGGGRTPCAWPRLSSGIHDAEATVFAGFWVLTWQQMESIRKDTYGSVKDAAYMISEIFMWSRYIPETGIPKPKPKVKKKPLCPAKPRSVYTEHQRNVNAMAHRPKYEDD